MVEKIEVQILGEGDLPEELNKSTKALGQLEQGLTNTEKAVAGTRTTILGLDKDMSAFGKNIGSTNDLLSGLGVSIPTTPMNALGLAISKTADFTRKAINLTVDYNKEIREMTQVTGLGAAEISRIIQVGDDWGISLEQLRTSLGLMQKNGVSPSIENLAKLADEYVNTTDKTKFAEKANQLLGRSWQTLIPLLAKGGQAFKDQAANIDASLLATDKSIRQARAFEIALDNLNDKWTAINYNVGKNTIPLVTYFLEMLDKNSPRATLAAELVAKGVAKTGDEAYKMAGKFMEANQIIEEELNLLPQLVDGHELAAKAINDVNNENKNLVAYGPAFVAQLVAQKQHMDALAVQSDLARQALNRIWLEQQKLQDKTININVVTNYRTTGNTNMVGGGNPADQHYEGEPGPMGLRWHWNGSKWILLSGKAAGGPVSAGVPYLVGEMGPELFIPNMGGQIMPNQVTNNYFNLAMSTVQSSGSVVNDFALMKALAG